MKPLKSFKTTFWGQKCVCRPMLLDHVFGDGKERIWIEHMDDRPDYYVVRVSSGTHALIESQNDEWYDHLLPSIQNTIEDEAMEFYSNRQWNEHERNGYVKTRKWPIPPHMPSGTAWGVIKPK